MSSESQNFLEQRARLKSWAGTMESAPAGAIVNDLTEIWAAARALVAAIESLPSGDPRSSGKHLIEVQVSLYEELLDHAASLRAPLQAALDDVYARGWNR